VEAVLHVLPLSVAVVHVAWSGDMLMSAGPHELPIRDFENEVRLVRPGDLAWDPRFRELGFVYGTAECYLPSIPKTLVVYGAIQQGLDDFASFALARRFQGMAGLSMKHSS